MKPTKRQAAYAPILLSPTRLFVYAQAFHFSSGRGGCFSPGLRSLCQWHMRRLSAGLKQGARDRFKRCRVWFERC